MSDLLNQRIPTRENIVMTMPPETCAAFISHTRKKLRKTVALRWQHDFLKDIEAQVSGRYRTSLSPKQAAHLLRTAEIAGIDFDDFLQAGNQ